LWNVTEFSGLEYFNTEKVTDMGSMFSMCESLTSLDLSNFNTEKVTNMGGMFDDCSSLTSLDLSKFNTEKVTNMNSMFAYCSNLKTIYVGDKWTTKNVTSSRDMFLNSENLVGGKGTKYDKDNVVVSYARIDGGADAPGYLTAIAPAKIAIKTVPAKTEYVIGDRLSLDGGSLEITYNTGNKETIDLSKANVSGFNSNKEGVLVLTVEYQDLTTTFKVSIVSKVPKEIIVTKRPTKTEYIVGEQFSAEGGKFDLVYNDKSTKSYDLTEAAISGFDADKIGTQTLKVVFQDFETTLKVSVVPEPPTKIAVTTLPKKVEYIEGEKLDIVGMVIAAIGVTTLQVRQRWYARELNNLEYVRQLLCYESKE
jgi:surface protein